MNNSKNQITRIMHWSFSFFVLVMLTLGFYMISSEYNPDLYTWHKSLGVLFSLVIGLRIYWTIKHPWQSSTKLNKYENFARTNIHRILIFLFILMPVTGLLSSAYSGWSVHFFDFTIVPKNMNSLGKVEPFNLDIYKTVKFLHRIFAYSFTILISLHVFAVLKHHFINKDQTLLEMLKRKKTT